jgi:hypothetical protein
VVAEYRQNALAGLGFVVLAIGASWMYTAKPHHGGFWTWQMIAAAFVMGVGLVVALAVIFDWIPAMRHRHGPSGHPLLLPEGITTATVEMSFGSAAQAPSKAQARRTLAGVPVLGQVPRASSEDLRGDTIVERELRIVDLAGDKLVVREKTFEGCIIRGPAVILPVATHFFGCTVMQHYVGIESVLWPPPAVPFVVGCVALERCVLAECRIMEIGFTGPTEELDKMRAWAAQATPHPKPPATPLDPNG